MKTKLLILAALLGAGACAQAQNNDYELRTLTFEDKDYKGNGSMQSTNQANWSSLIDNPQYGGKLLYGESKQGCTSNEPFDGVNIKVTTYSDGSVKTIKLVK